MEEREVATRVEVVVPREEGETKAEREAVEAWGGTVP